MMETFEKHLHLPVTKIDDSKRMLAKLKVSLLMWLAGAASWPSSLRHLRSLPKR